MQQGSRAVADAALAGQVAGGFVENLYLMIETMIDVGIAEVGDERNFVHLRQRIQAGIGGSKAVGRESKAVHAAVHLEKDAVANLGLVSGQPVDLLITVHGMPDAETRTQFQVARLEHAF